MAIATPPCHQDARKLAMSAIIRTMDLVPTRISTLILLHITNIHIGLCQRTPLVSSTSQHPMFNTSLMCHHSHPQLLLGRSLLGRLARGRSLHREKRTIKKVSKARGHLSRMRFTVLATVALKHMPSCRRGLEVMIKVTNSCCFKMAVIRAKKMALIGLYTVTNAETNNVNSDVSWLRRILFFTCVFTRPETLTITHTLPKASNQRRPSRSTLILSTLWKRTLKKKNVVGLVWCP